MTYRRWQMADPLEVLIRKGEGCDKCVHLETWRMAERSAQVCEKGKKVGKRCQDWRHEQADGEV